MQQSRLTEHQLEIMRLTYPGFRACEEATRRVKIEEKKYRENPGYVPNKEPLPDGVSYA